MVFKNRQLLIFDLDGTLIDSVPDLASAVNEMLVTLKRNPFDEATIRFWVGNGAQTLVKRALSGSEVVDTALDETRFNKALQIFLTAYAKHLSIHTCTYPHVRETLQLLKESGYTLAIVTNKPESFVLPLLEGLGIDDFFDYFVGGDSLSAKKPDPMPLLHVCERLKVTVEETVMIGDSKNDILAAKAAGMDAIAVTYGYNYGEDISSYKPEVVVDDFAEIPGHLER